MLAERRIQRKKRADRRNAVKKGLRKAGLLWYNDVRYMSGRNVRQKNMRGEGKSMKMMMKAAAMLMALVMLLGCMSAALAEPGAPASRPVIVSGPSDRTVKQGGKISFEVQQTGAKGITWRLYNPDTEETVLASKAAKRFKGLKVAGPNRETLTLSRIPAELNGWEVYCTLANSTGKSVTRFARITLTDNNGEPLGKVNQTAETADVAFTVTCTGAKAILLDDNGGTIGKAASKLSGKGKYNVRVTAQVPKDREIECWFINQEPYYFGVQVTTIEVTGWTGNAVFEIVLADKE